MAKEGGVGEEDVGEDFACYDKCVIVRTTSLTQECVIPVGGNMLVGDLKREVESNLQMPVATQQLSFRGRVLQDDTRLSALGLLDESVIFVRELERAHSFVPSFVSTSESAPPPTSTLAFPSDATLSSDLNTSLPTMPHAPSTGLSPMGLVAEMMANNPELAMSLLQMDPRFKTLLERNPQVRHALEDPETLRQIFKTSTNPNLHHEMMRGHERTMAHIENIPGGFQALQRMYLDNVQALDDIPQQTARFPSQITTSSPDCRRTTMPMPNPWASQSTSRTTTGTMDGRELRQVPPPSSSLIMPDGNGDPWRRPFSLQNDPFPPTDQHHHQSPPPCSSSSDLHDVHQPSTLPEIGSMGNTAIPAEFDVLVYQERFHTQLEAMREMGFTDTRENIRALLATGGNVSSAVERLLSKPE